MTKYITMFILVFGSIVAKGQDGILFPTLVGETLEENTFSLPQDTKGKITIIGMAYSKSSESTLHTWQQPMYDKFVLKKGMFDSQYNVNFYFVPMYIGLKKAAYKGTIKKLKESNRKDLYPHILFYKGDLEPYGSALKMNDKKLPYLFVLDEEGKILYHTKGLYSASKMEKIEEILDSRLD